MSNSFIEHLNEIYPGKPVIDCTTCFDILHEQKVAFLFEISKYKNCWERMQRLLEYTTWNDLIVCVNAKMTCTFMSLK